MSKVLSIVIKIIGFVIFLLGAALSANALIYANFDFTYGFLKLKQEAIATGWYLPAYYSHVLVAGIVLLVGFFQLHPTVGRRWIKLHRSMGYVYIMGILFFSAPGGLIMSFFINRGLLVLISFILQACLWFFFTAIAFNKIKNKDIDAHREWMWRSFALTFAAITLRIYIFIGAYFTDLTAPAAYASIAWMSWGPNLLVVEYYLYTTRAKKRLLNFFD